MASRFTLFSARRPQAGFALLIVLSLLGLIVIVLVSLAAFTRVETNVAASAQYESQARQNAFTALNLAIGQLQREAGPDQRVTGTGALAGANLNQNPYWTGVWDSSAGGASTSRGFQSWLVNPANGTLTSSTEATQTKAVLTATTSGTNAAGDDGVVQLVGTGPDDSAAPNNVNDSRNIDGSVVLSPPLGEPGNGGPANAQFVTLKLDRLSASGLPGFGAADFRDFGRIAWWTADDGVKASLSGVNRLDEVTFNDTSGEDYSGGAFTDAGYVKRERLAAMNMQVARSDLSLRNYSGTDLVASNLNVDIFGAMLHPVSEQYLGRVDSIFQYTGAVRAAGTYTNPALTLSPTRDNYRYLHLRMRERFHDVTPATFSVLSNTAAGGLKQDLDLLTPVTVTPATLSEVARYAASRVSSAGGGAAGLLRSRIQFSQLVAPPSSLYGGSMPSNEPVAVIGPVISECELIFEYQQTATGEMEVTIKGQVELWNPYNATMEMRALAGHSWSLRILVEGLAGKQFSDIELTDGIRSSGTPAMDIGQTLGLPAGPSTYVFPLNPPAAALPADINPGEATTWTITPQVFTVKDAGGVNLTGFEPSGPSTVSVRLPATSKLTVTLLRIDSSSGSPVVEDFYQVADVAYTDVLTATATDGVRYYFRLNDETDFAAPSFWLEAYDPRCPRIVPTATNSPIFVGSGDPAALVSNSLFDSGGELIKDAGLGAPPVIIADLPRQQFTSIGLLQQMPHTGTTNTNSSAFRLGSGGANASPFNSLFDSHYFSTVPKAAGTWIPGAASPTALPNTTLVPINRLSGPPSLANIQNVTVAAPKTYSASYLLARDTLNVNSVSVTAWRSVLGGSLPGFDLDWDGAATPAIESGLRGRWRTINNTSAVVTENVYNTFFRLPQTGADLRANYASTKADLTAGSATTREAAAYRLGIRELSNAQVNALATEVVRLILLRSGPFRSMQDFVDSGLLQTAIDNTNLNNPVATRLPAKSTAYLTQGDILQSIGNRLVARSDTFTIRAYGEAGTPALDPNDSNFVKGRAWLEATVQRMPIKKANTITPNVADDMTDTGATAGTDLGREFRIVSFRWLTPTDL